MTSNNNFNRTGSLLDGRPSSADKAESHSTPRMSKKERIIDLFRQGCHSLTEIVRETGASPSYAAAVLTEAGLLTGYFDLYTTTNHPQNLYSKFFRGVLSFKSVEAARASVERIDRLFHYFEGLGDRAGQHHAQVVALTGRNRARWCGKHHEAQIFTAWLNAH
jgi:hypothetical protein